MKIYTHLVFDIDTLSVVESEWYEYDGSVALCCGATAAQTQAQQGQADLFSQMTNQAQSVFGSSSQVFQQLQKTFAPIVAAGPSQQGFSPAEASNLQSAAITNTGQAYKNAKEATGNAEDAVGGGNTGDVTSGSRTATDLGIADSAAQQTSGELNQINEANYQTGRQNFDNATKTLESAPDVFNPATSAGSAAIGAGSASANTANNIAASNNSWMQVVGGVLGGVGGAVAGGLSKGLTGRSSAPSPSIPSGGGSGIDSGAYGPDSD